MPASTQKRPRQDALSEPGSPKRPRTMMTAHSSANQPALQSSDRATSPITSRTASMTSSSSPGTSDDERNGHMPARASGLTRQRNSQPQPRGADDDGDDDDTSSDESTSSESASSNEEHDEEENEEEEENDPSVPRLPAMQKPRIHRVDKQKQPDLLARVSSFLPRMKDANDSLQRDIAAGRASDVMVDDVGEGHEGRYIEMNLGLGVLEEKHSDDDDDASSSGDEGDSDSAEQNRGSSRDSNVLGRLMGKESASSKPTIEEVNQ